MIVAGLWVNKAGYWVESLNALSIEGQGKLITVGNKIVDTFSSKSDSSLSMDDVQKGKELEGTTAVLRNFYFDAALKSPYLVTNYGTPNEKTILKKGNGEGGLDRIDTLLSFRLTSDGQSAKKEFINKKEIKEYKNQSIAEGNVFAQLGYSFIGLLAAISLGMPFFLIAFLNFLIQIIVLAIAFFLPFAFILSYVPQFAYSGFVSLGRMFALFVMKALLTLVLVFVYAICVITNKTIPPTNLGMYFVNVVAMSVILIIAFVKRDKIIKFVTAGKVQNVDGNLLENTKKAVVQPSWEGMKKVGNNFSEWKKKRDAAKAAEEQSLGDKRSAPQSTVGNSKFDRTSQNNPLKKDASEKKEIERGRQLNEPNVDVDSKADDYKPPLYVVDGGKEERTDQTETGARASNQLPKVDIERSEQATKDQLAEESNNKASVSNQLPKVDVERSEQATKDQLAEETNKMSNVSNPMSKVDVERSEQATKDQLAEEGNNNSSASTKISMVDAERSDQYIKEQMAEEKTVSPKASTSVHEVDVERSDQDFNEKTLTNVSNPKPLNAVSNVERNEQIQSEEKVSASVPKTENEKVKTSDTQPKTKRVIQQQPKHVKIELDQIESRQSKSDRGGSRS